MPTLRGITVSLQSQYDALPITECTFGPTDASTAPENKSNSQTSATVDMSIPTYPSSQFWISYVCMPPCTSPPPTGRHVRFFYFKLVVDGKCVLSWGVGKEDKWAGKTVHTLFAAGTDFEGRKLVEKRGFFFPGAATAHAGRGHAFEIQVFRATARKRQAVQHTAFRDMNLDRAAFDLTNKGYVRKDERLRMYTYALMDPKDEPYVTFRYHFRARDESIVGRHELPASSMKSPARCGNSLQAQEPEKRSLRRLSFPPQRKLVPNTKPMAACSPLKKGAISTNEAGHAEAVDPEEQKRSQWFNRTPSPMLATLFGRPASPPAERRKAGSTSLLKDVVANALKR